MSKTESKDTMFPQSSNHSSSTTLLNILSILILFLLFSQVSLQPPPTTIIGEGLTYSEYSNSLLTASYFETNNVMFLTDYFNFTSSPQQDYLQRDNSGYVRRFLLLAPNGTFYSDYTLLNTEFISYSKFTECVPKKFGAKGASTFLFAFVSKFETYSLDGTGADTVIKRLSSFEFPSSLKTVYFALTFEETTYVILFHSLDSVESKYSLTKYDLNTIYLAPSSLGKIDQTLFDSEYVSTRFDADRFLISGSCQSCTSDFSIMIYSIATISQLNYIRSNESLLPSNSQSSLNIILQDSKYLNKTYISYAGLIVNYNLVSPGPSYIRGAVSTQTPGLIITNMVEIPQTEYIMISFTKPTAVIPPLAAAIIFYSVSNNSKGGVAIISKSSISDGVKYTINNTFPLSMANEDESMPGSLQFSKLQNGLFYFSFGYKAKAIDLNPVARFRMFSMSWPGVCSVSNCRSCAASSTTSCVQCEEGYFLVDRQCYTKYSIPNGWGVEGPTTASPCTNRGCLVCRLDMKRCEMCKTGFEISAGGVCFKAIQISFSYDEFLNDDGKLIFYAEEASLEPVLSGFSKTELSEITVDYFPKWTFVDFFDSSGSKVRNSEAKSMYSVVNYQNFILKVSYTTGDTQAEELTIRTSNTEVFYVKDSVYYAVKDGETKLKPDLSNLVPSTVLNKYESTGQTISTMTGVTDSYTISAIFATIFGFDFTGILIRFAQILKIVNKMRFMQLNYGSRFYIFLKNIGDLFVFIGPKNQKRDVINSVGYRGTISKQYVDLEFGRVFADKIPLYLLSWFLLISNFSLRHFKIKVPKFYLHVMFYHQKFHPMIFNIIVIDFLFYGTRSILHISSGLPGNLFFAYFCLFFVSLDFFLLFWAVFEDKLWLRVYHMNLRKEFPERFLPKGEGLVKLIEKEISQFNKEAEKESSPSIEKEDEDGEKKGNILKDDEMIGNKGEKEKDQENRKVEEPRKQIDFVKTYDYLHSVQKHVEFLAIPLDFKKNTYQDRFCRVYSLVLIIRVSFYQIFIVSCQYVSGLLIVVLIGVETVKFYVTIRGSQGRILLANRVLYFAEITQSIFTIFILAFFFFLHFRTKYDIIETGTQLFGVIVITIAVLSEWAFTLINIVYLLSLFVKKQKKRVPSTFKEVYIFYKDGTGQVEEDQNDSSKNKHPISKVSHSHIKPQTGLKQDPIKVHSPLYLEPKKIPRPLDLNGIKKFDPNSEERRNDQSKDLLLDNRLPNNYFDMELDSPERKVNKVIIFNAEFSPKESKNIHKKIYSNELDKYQPSPNRSIHNKEELKLNNWVKRNKDISLSKQKVLEDSLAIANSEGGKREVGGGSNNPHNNRDDRFKLGNIRSEDSNIRMREIDEYYLEEQPQETNLRGGRFGKMQSDVRGWKIEDRGSQVDEMKNEKGMKSKEIKERMDEVDEWELNSK